MKVTVTLFHDIFIKSDYTGQVGVSRKRREEYLDISRINKYIKKPAKFRIRCWIRGGSVVNKSGSVVGSEDPFIPRGCVKRRPDYLERARIKNSIKKTKFQI